jgi:hypothetical protein
MGALRKLIIMACSVFITDYSYAEQKTVEFSAEAVISAPQQAARQTKLSVSEKAVRTETTVNGQSIIEIVYPEEGRAILINNSLRSYREKVFDQQSSKKNSDTPCDQISNAICEKLGTENIDGHDTEKWQIISENRGRKLRTLHWMDIKRKLALREFFPDGSVAELKMLKKEKLNGRNTEKWQRTLSRPNGKSTISYQWYDPALKIAIKEELPGGYIRELKNIVVSRQSDNLFSVPDDFVKMESQSMRPEY